jgi:glycosyltransferase involved in cell wall biosynthesis
VQLLMPEELASPYLDRLPSSVQFQPFRKPRYREVPGQVRTTYSLVRQVRDFNPDVIHLQQGHLWFNLALPFLGGYPLVVTVHDPRHHIGDLASRKVPQGVYDFGFRRASRLIVHGEEMRRIVGEELRIPEEMLHIIPHIVLGDESAASGVQEQPSTILFFGRIWEYKGLDYLIRAEPLIRAEVPDVRIIIAGTGEDFAKYRAMMADPSRFEVHNEFVPDDMRAELFARSAVVVLPYIEATQSGVIPVAYTFSKPVVATTVGSLPEMVDHGRTGLLVPPRSEEALAEAIVQLLRDEALRRQMGEGGKRKIDSEASPEVVAGKTLEVYRRALEDVQTRTMSRAS